jgi:predicted phosphodiesterase
MIAAALLYAWIQYGADGETHVRALPSGQTCPTVMVDGAPVKTTMRVGSSKAFAPPLCDALITSRATDVRIGTLRLPRMPERVNRIAVLGDSGCRIKTVLIQNCNDPKAWPFARIARSIARDKPDLIIHVGDYLYRETPCLPFDGRCAHTPYGDNWPAWNVDFFAPAAPLFAAAPLIFARGNHEDCSRAGMGWTRYLAPKPAHTCREQERPAITSFDNLRIVNIDSAAGDEDSDPDPLPFERDERIADAASQGRETWVLTHRPPLKYLRKHAANDPNGPHIAAIIAGHIHMFAAMPFAGAPPTILVGTGGDTLSRYYPDVKAVAGAVGESRFGYAIFERTGDGWTISERDPGGSEHRKCVLRNRTVHC